MINKVHKTSQLVSAIRSGLVAVALIVASVATLAALTSSATIGVAVEVGKQEPLTIVTDKGKTTFQVEIANTDATRAEGLMYRSTMPADQGMLFDFKATDTVYFWMKNTYIPLDMIFIRADGTVAHIAENTTPLSEKTVPSGEPVRFVLEVNAGTAARLDLKVGDRVLHRLMKSGAG